MFALIISAVIVTSIAYAFIKKIPVSLMIIISNIVIFLITMFYPSIINELAFNPIYFHNLPKMYTIFTSMFLHGGFYHLLFNMIGLFFIGLPFEHEVGTRKFTAIYFISGVSAALFFSLYRFGEIYLIGASGAIFGILGAFAVSYPFKKVVVPLPIFVILFIRMPVIVLALLYAGIETLYTLFGSPDGVAHSAHLGGFIAGVFLYPFIKVKVEEEKEINLDDLEDLLEDEKQREIFEKAKQADEKDVRDAWLSYLFKYLKCPNCGGELEIKNGIRCRKCGYRK